MEGSTDGQAPLSIKTTSRKKKKTVLPEKKKILEKKLKDKDNGRGDQLTRPIKKYLSIQILVDKRKAGKDKGGEGRGGRRKGFETKEYNREELLFVEILLKTRTAGRIIPKGGSAKESQRKRRKRKDIVL